MLKHIPFSSLFKTDHGWLQSRFHFSFAEYFDRNSMHYGALRVMNDDIIAPYTGFDTHPHRDMEIITYIIQGKLTHQDSIGNKESLGRGCIQYLSAGTGITHSEFNDGDEEVHLIQSWILPSEKNLTPQYGSKMFTPQERHNCWLHLVGPVGTAHVVGIYQDVNMYVTELDKDRHFAFDLVAGRQLYIKVMEGNVRMNGTLFEQGDAGMLAQEALEIEAITAAHILLVEMEEDK